MTVASKSKRRDLTTFEREGLQVHPLAQRNTKQIQNFGYPAGNKSTCKPGHKPPIPVPRVIGEKTIDVGQIPED